MFSLNTNLNETEQRTS